MSDACTQCGYWINHRLNCPNANIFVTVSHNSSSSDYIPDHLKYERIKELESELASLKQRLEAAEAVCACLEHAVELGHRGEGSTANWAKQTLAAWRSLAAKESDNA